MIKRPDVCEFFHSVDAGQKPVFDGFRVRHQFGITQRAEIIEGGYACVITAPWHSGIEVLCACHARDGRGEDRCGSRCRCQHAVAGAVQTVIGAADGGDACCGQRFELACVIDAVFVGILPDRQASQLVA